MDDGDGEQAPKIVHLKPLRNLELDLFLRKDVGQIEGPSMARYPAWPSLTEVHPGVWIIRADAVVGIRLIQGLCGFVGNPDPDTRDLHEFRGGLGDLAEHI